MVGTKIKMYLRVCCTRHFVRFPNLRVSQLSIPDTTSPGTPIALFREEENLKILKFKIHPLNQELVPYSFDESIYPLLNKAARALNLPIRSEQSYLSLFMSNMSMATNTDPYTALDDRYTGTILVNDYNVCFVTPREIPVIPRDPSSMPRTTSTPQHKRLILWLLSKCGSRTHVPLQTHLMFSRYLPPGVYQTKFASGSFHQIPPKFQALMRHYPQRRMK
jgi:hypothetical protein